jgi:hypothetical protein
LIHIDEPVGKTYLSQLATHQGILVFGGDIDHVFGASGK